MQSLAALLVFFAGETGTTGAHESVALSQHLSGQTTVGVTVRLIKLGHKQKMLTGNKKIDHIFILWLFMPMFLSL